MQKSSLKLYFATFLFTLSLASFTFAGEVHCPLTDPPPPPPGDGDTGRIAVVINPDSSVKDNYQFLTGFWELFTFNTIQK
jgi:hypothetical protein